MDPLTASLHDCSHRFIPHVKDGQSAATIQYGGAYYTIVIQKQPAYPSYTAPAVAAMVKASQASQASQDKSVLGKRPSEQELSGHTISYRRTEYDLMNNTLYPNIGHEFK